MGRQYATAAIDVFNSWAKSLASGWIVAAAWGNYIMSGLKKTLRSLGEVLCAMSYSLNS